MEKNSFDYERALRGLDFAKYHYDSLIALLKYKNDRMIELNKTRAVGSIDLVIAELTELKEELSKTK
jgi:flagellin-specific chaperone FliS